MYHLAVVRKSWTCLWSLEAVQLCTHKNLSIILFLVKKGRIRNDLKNRIRIRTKSFQIHNTATACVSDPLPEQLNFLLSYTAPPFSLSPIAIQYRQSRSSRSMTNLSIATLWQSRIKNSEKQDGGAHLMAEYLCDPGDEAEVQASALSPALLVARACHQTKSKVLGLLILIFIFQFYVFFLLSFLLF